MEGSLDLYLEDNNIEATVRVYDIKRKTTVLFESCYKPEDILPDKVGEELSETKINNLKAIITESLESYFVFPINIENLYFKDKYYVIFDITLYDKEEPRIQDKLKYSHKIKDIQKIRNVDIRLNRIVEHTADKIVFKIIGLKVSEETDSEFTIAKRYERILTGYLGYETEWAVERVNGMFDSDTYTFIMHKNKPLNERYEYKGLKVFARDKTANILRLGEAFAILYRITSYFNNATDEEVKILFEAGIYIKDETIYFNSKPIAKIVDYNEALYNFSEMIDYNATFDLLDADVNKLKLKMLQMNKLLIRAIIKAEGLEIKSEYVRPNFWKQDITTLTLNNEGVFKYKRLTYQYRLVDIRDFKIKTDIITDKSI